MARSQEGAMVAELLGDKKTKEDHQPHPPSKPVRNDEGVSRKKNREGLEVTMERGQSAPSERTNRRRILSKKEPRVVPAERESGETVMKTTLGGTDVSATTFCHEDTLQADIVVQVLEDFHSKTKVKVKYTKKPRTWPLFKLRRLFGLAHVGLHDAVLDGDIKHVKIILSRYIRGHSKMINDYDEEGRTALALALMEKREDIADVILSVDQTDINKAGTVTGATPLHIAVLLNLSASAQKLALRGSNVNAKDKTGITPLMLGCSLGLELMVEMFIEDFGAEVDLADKAGWTCLFFATYCNKISIIEFLLVKGADPDHQDKRGMKAVDLGPDDKRNVFAQFESALDP